MSTRTRAALRQRKQSSRRPLYAAIAVIVAIAAGSAIVATRGSSPSRSAEPQTRPVTVTGTPLPPYSNQKAIDPAVGATIPALSGANFAGQPVHISNNGKPKVLLFVAHWCPHCRREVPLLAPDLRAHPLPTGVEMYTISTGVMPSAPNYPPSAWLASVNWPTPVIADDANSSAATAFGLTSYPYFVFVDGHGKVVARTSGEITLAQFRQEVAKLS